MIISFGVIFILVIMLILSAAWISYLLDGIKKLKKDLREKGMNCYELRKRAQTAETKIRKATQWATDYRDKTTYGQKLEDGAFWEGICSIIEELDPTWETGPINSDDILNEKFSN